MSETIWRRARRLWRTTVQDDVDDEVSFHFQMRVDQFVAAGMSRAEAQRAASERFGDVGETRSELVDIGRRARRKRDIREHVHVIWQDVIVSIRSLRREPLFALGVIITLGLGVGANATMFGVIDRLMLRGPEHVVDSKRVDRLYITVNTPTQGVQTSSTLGYVTYALLRDHAKAFAAVGAYRSMGNQILFGKGISVRPIADAEATWDLFPLLGVRPALGRFYDSAEDHPPLGERVVVLSYEFWQSEFGGDPHVIGQRIALNDALHTIIGVAPSGFTGPERVRADVWRPMSLITPQPDWPTTYQSQWLRIVARLAPGMSPEAAGAEATNILRAAYAGDQAFMHQLTASVRPLWFGRAGEPPPIANVSRWLMGVAVVVLLITCANVANLLVARTRRRRREIAVRLALGVGRRGLLRLLLTETMLVALGGAAVALGIAAAGGHLMRVTLLSEVAWSGSPVDGRVFAFTLAVAIGVGLFVGLGPAWEATRLNLTGSLKTASGDGGGRRQSIRTVLSIVQAAFSVMLLIGAALFVESLSRVRGVDLGFQPSRVLRADPRFVGPTPAPPNWKAERARIFDETLVRLSRLPWVEHAAISVGSPYGFGFSVHATTPGRDSVDSGAGGGPYISAVTSEFFSTLGISLRRGRLFTAADRAGSAPVTIVGETMARAIWPGLDPIGKCLIIGDRTPNGPPPACSTVVGVVGDVHRESVREPPLMQFYIPLGQEAALGFGGSVFVVRPRIAMADARAALRREMASMPEFSYTKLETIQEVIDPEFRPWKLGAAMFGVFGVLALIVAAVGLYSVIAYLVADRSRELGIRLALGATAGRVVREVVTRGVATTVVGAVIGTMAALALGRFIQPLLFNVSARDPLVLGVVVAIVIAIAVAASWGPARRAGRVDPAIALRAD